MDIFLIIFIIIVAISAFRGYKSGILVIVSRTISLASAYLVAIIFTDKFANWLQQISPVKGLFAYALAGVILFTITGLLLSTVLSLITKKLASKSAQPELPSAAAGGLIGAVIGGVIGIFAIWFISAFQGILQVKKGEAISYSSFQKTSQKIIKGAIKGVAEAASNHSDIASGAAQLVSNPAENIQHFNQLTKQGILRDFLQNHQVRSALDSQDSYALLNSVEFEKLMENPDFIALTKSLSLPEDKSERDHQVALKITNTWAQIDQVQNNQEYLELMQDPEVKQAFQSGNLLKLLNNQKIERILSIISSSEVDLKKVVGKEILAQEFTEQTSEKNETASTRLQSKIYRWVDEEGKVHYSDKPRKER